MSAAIRGPSTTQARLGVLARLSITGPGMPKQAASNLSPTGPTGPAPRKAWITAARPGKSGLWNLSARTSRSSCPRRSNSPRLVFVPPTSPARITVTPGLLERRPQILDQPAQPLVVVVAELHAQHLAPALLQRLAVPLGLGVDQGAEGVVGLRHGQILRRLVDQLQEAAAVRSPLVQLPRRVEEARAIAEGHREPGLLVQRRLERAQLLGL